MQLAQVRTAHRAQVPEVTEAHLRQTPCSPKEPPPRRKGLPKVIRLIAGAGAVERDRLDSSLVVKDEWESRSCRGEQKASR
eukprot:12924993-Prorocentrum_lima.AAC.1